MIPRRSKSGPHAPPGYPRRLGPSPTQFVDKEPTKSKVRQLTEIEETGKLLDVTAVTVAQELGRSDIGI